MKYGVQRFRIYFLSQQEALFPWETMPLVGIRKNAYSNVDFFAIINTYIQNREANKSSKRRDSVQNGVKTLFYHWKRQKSNIISYSPSSPYPFLNIINHSSSNFLSILYSLINRFTFNSQFQLIIINETPSHFDVSTIDQTTQRIILSYPLDNVRTFIRWNS